MQIDPKESLIILGQFGIIQNLQKAPLFHKQKLLHKGHKISKANLKLPCFHDLKITNEIILP